MLFPFSQPFSRRILSLPQLQPHSYPNTDTMAGFSGVKSSAEVPSDPSFDEVHDMGNTFNLLQSADQVPSQAGSDTFNSSLPDGRSAPSGAPVTSSQYLAYPQVDEHRQPIHVNPQPGVNFPVGNSSGAPVAAPFGGAMPELLGELQDVVNHLPLGDGTYTGAYTTQDNTRTLYWNHGTFFPYLSTQQGAPDHPLSTASDSQNPQLTQHSAGLNPIRHEAYGQAPQHDADAMPAQLLGDNALASQGNGLLNPFGPAAPHPANPTPLTIPAYHQGLANHHVNSALALGLLNPLPLLPLQPHQDQPANPLAEEEAAHAISGLAHGNNPPPPPPHPPANGGGRRAQRSARLHAQGLCIWCRQPNPDLSKMGCPACLPKRAAKTAQYRVRRNRLARERAEPEPEHAVEGLVPTQGGSVEGDGKVKEGGEVEKGEGEDEDEEDEEE